jgi:hydroxymethylpyrimidine pyrophosphatase-like HAD family hydrolase
VECTHKDVSKLNSIDRVLSKKWLVRENLMAIGDGYNDIEMIKGAKLGFAMGNAVEEVKKIAKMVVSDNDSAGVAEAIYRTLK